MKFVRVDGWEPAEHALIKRLQTELKAGKRVLWLIGGGSGIHATVTVMSALPAELTERLSIFMTDERYGEVGHTNSNARQLHDAGFETKEAVFVPMLQAGFSMAETQERYEQALRQAVEHADIVIAQSGIGADGHIAGILPHSTAVTAAGWITTYEAPHYTRMTMTFEALRQIDAAYYMAFGDEKKPALTALRDELLPLAEQPAQILREIPEAYVYNDQIEGDAK